MGQTAQTVVTDISDHPIARKRTGKPLRGSGHYTGNLTAFKSLQTGEQATPPVDSAQRGKLKSRSYAERYTHLRESASNDSVIVQKAKNAPTVGPRSKIATAVLIALATGAVLGSIWTASKLTGAAQPATESAANTQTSNTQSVATPQPVAAEVTNDSEASLAQTSAPNTVEALPAETAIDPIIEELTATRNLADQYLEEIEWLHDQNGLLQEEIIALNNETTSLNYDLLQLELELAALEAEAQPIVETRTVYNFVNVPIGSGVEQSSYEPTATENYNEPVEYTDGYDEEENLDKLIDQDTPVFWDEDQRVDFLGNNPQEELYPEDLYTQEELEAQLLDDALIYDPETGYYIDPNYVSGDDDINTPSRQIEYPPIVPGN